LKMCCHATVGKADKSDPLWGPGIEDFV